MSNKRFNICILSATLTDSFSNDLVKGAITAAKQLDVDLTVIPGKYLGVQDMNDKFEAYYEYQYNVLFSYAAKANFDYVIAPVGTIAYACNNELKKSFLDTFSGTPLLCVASDIEGYDCLEFDNGAGMISAVDYLAQRGRKHIGIMAGGPDYNEGIERYEAYRKALENNGLEFKDSYLMYCDISYDCKEEAGQLRDSNPEIDAVLCVNDIIASVVYSAVEERGKKVGEDIAVIGFDDLPFAKEMDPPLASIKADAFQLGYVSLEKAYNYLNGIKDDRHLVGTKFIPRSSCFADKRFLKTPELLFIGDTGEIKKNLTEYIADGTDSKEEARSIFEPLSELIDLLEGEFLLSAADDTSVKTAYDKIVGIFKNDGTVRGEASKLYAIRENLFIWLLRKCMQENLPYVRKLLIDVGKITGEKTSAMPQRFIDRTHMNNMFIRDSLMFGGDLKNSYADILKRLCNVGSLTSYLYILDEPVEHRSGEEYPDDVKWLFKSYCYGADCFNIPEDEQRMETFGVFDNKKLTADRTRILIAVDLFSAQTQYGMALLEPESFDIIDDLELITYQLSSAVKSLDILKNLNNLLTETRLALAMANDYKYIYCIDTKTGGYIQYARERTDKDFIVEYKGADFTADCKKECFERVFEEDRALFKDMFSMDTFNKRISAGDLFNFDYRYLMDGEPVYHRLKTIIGTDENEGSVFFGITDIDAQKRRELEMKAELFKDALTGVKNKSAYRHSESKIDTLIREDIAEDFSVFVFDLNDLKKVNDSLGHDEGDKYIRSGSALICSTFDHSPVFRIGGDEFAAILTGSDYEARAKLKAAIKYRVRKNKQTGSVVIAVGSADFIPGKDTCLLDVFKRADKEMYEDKRLLKTKKA